MNIGILTSSRADFGIYYPLLKELKNDKSFNLEIIAFGSHLKKKYGYTFEEINKHGFDVKHRINTSTKNSTASDISYNIGDTIKKFSRFWDKNKFDLIFALGDRYEMFAAVSAASTFNIDISHIHAGETTLGAIDNAYRHSISLMSKYLFVSTNDYKERAEQIINLSNRVFNVGALSVDNLIKQELFTIQQFNTEFNIDLTKPSILSTFHPETISFDKNQEYIEELISTFKSLNAKYQIIITMPNSDTMGDMIRNKLINFAKDYDNIKLIESFGMKGYLSCMKYCSFLLGNTSSGFVEASFFPKWVINLGNRQNGRLITENIIDTTITKAAILNSVSKIENTKLPECKNIYGNGTAAKNITAKIKSLYGLK